MSDERFPFGPLEDAARGGLPRHDFTTDCPFCSTAADGSIGCVNDHQLAGILGVSHRTIYRYRTTGLTQDAADRFAVALGHHPAEIWDQWGQIEWTEEAEAA